MRADNTSLSSPVRQGKNIYYSIYGLLATVIIVFTVILAMFQTQQAELSKIEDLANNYHLTISGHSLAIIGESEKMMLWYRDYIAESGNMEHELQITTHVSLSNKIRALDLVLDSRIEKIKQIQKQYTDPEFEGIVVILQRIESKVDEGLSGLLIAKTHSSHEIDKILSPLISIAHQLQRLHEIAHGELEEKQVISRDRYNKFLIGVVTFFLLSGLFVVVKLLGHVRYTLTEQTRMHASAIENQERVQLILDSTAEAIYGVDMDGNCTFANLACICMLGYESESELLGRNMHIAIHHTRPDGTIFLREDCRICESYTQGQNSHVSDELLWRKDGTGFAAEYWSYPIFKNKKVIGSVVTFIDITERLTTESNLIQSEATMVEAQAIAHIGSWNWDMKTNEIAWSDEIYRIFGANPQGFTATYDAFLEYIHPEDRKSVVAAVEASVARSDVPYKEEHRIIREDGQERIVQEQGIVYRDNGGRPVRMIGTVLDITEKVISEQKLQKSQAEFSAMFESIPDAIVYADTGRRVQMINSAAFKLFGYSANELFGNETKMLYAEGAGFDKAGKEKFNKKAKAEGLPYEMIYQRKDGSTFVGETLGTPVKAPNGEILGFLGIIRDITERKQAEKELQHFRRTLDKTLDCVFMFNANDLYFSYVNEGALQQVGYSRDELFAMHPYDIKPEIDREKFQELIAPLLNGEQASLSFETIHQHKNGQLVPVEIFLQFVRQADGSSSFVAIVRDITERKQTEKELEKYRDGLEELVNLRTKDLRNAQDELVRKERLATLGQLTATISHELRNPLGAMRPSLYVINKKIDQDDERLRQAVERVDRNISRCDHIIDELLDYTRITDIDYQPHKLDIWLKNFIDGHQIPVGIEIETSFDLEGKIVLFDSGRLQRAVGNVVDNACHAMMDESTGEPNIPDAHISLSTQINKDHINITVSDNGSGIPEELLPKIFEPLFSTRGFGVGLGMPVIKQIMEQHGGGIEIDSKEGKGTTVTLWLPRKQDEEEVA